MASQQVVTLANSIIGVSVLAMPFCFKQCGIVLATLMLMLSAIVTRMVCYFLLKAGTLTRRRTYELLAYHTFGSAGKFMVEISIIGFLMGTLIAFLVAVGDLGPEIASDLFSLENNSNLRNIIMTALALFVALPLGLLRNIDSLSIVSTASVFFYIFLVFKILMEATGPLLSGSYLERIDYWRPAGVLQTIPILSMALSCQTQIFGIYDSLPEPSLQKMNDVVKKAINVCTLFYFCVGFFGYIAFSSQSFGGNILMSFSDSWSTETLKVCFLLSILFSFPLVIFPCRASLHSLVFRRGVEPSDFNYNSLLYTKMHMHHNVHDLSTNYIPENRMRFLTLAIVGLTLFFGLLIPNIELVLGLCGSTTGSVICIIFPSVMFIRVTSKNTTERLLAQVVFCIGVCIMVLTTYVSLSAVEQAELNNEPLPDQLRVTEVIKEINAGHADKVANVPVVDFQPIEGKAFSSSVKEKPPETAKQAVIEEPVISHSNSDDKHEHPIPIIHNDVKPGNNLEKSDVADVKAVPHRHEPKEKYFEGQNQQANFELGDKISQGQPIMHEPSRAENAGAPQVVPDSNAQDLPIRNQNDVQVQQQPSAGQPVENVNVNKQQEQQQSFNSGGEQKIDQRNEPAFIPQSPKLGETRNDKIGVQDNVQSQGQQNAYNQQPVVNVGAEAPKPISMNQGQHVLSAGQSQQQPPGPDGPESVQSIVQKIENIPVAAPEDKLKAEMLLKKLEEHEEKQEKILEEQKQILEQLKQHQEQDKKRDDDEKHETKVKVGSESVDKVKQEEVNVKMPERKEFVSVLKKEPIIAVSSPELVAKRRSEKSNDIVQKTKNEKVVPKKQQLFEAEQKVSIDAKSVDKVENSGAIKTKVLQDLEKRANEVVKKEEKVEKEKVVVQSQKADRDM